MGRIFEIDSVPVLETSGGKLKGYYYKGEYIYKGVPYARAKRFHQPEPVTWEGVKEASSYGYVCPLMSVDKPNGELLVPHRYWPQDENCQNLNIWTKTLDTQARQPVVVWLHGGGYAAGSSIEQVAYDGFKLAMQGDVVVVTINHRLNVLGYMDLSPFGEEYANSANAGHADMVAALAWIHENIMLFGGDPDNVTLFGQSGGGMKVLDLMQIPAADGLFHKGLVMSGVGGDELFAVSRGDGREIVTAMMKELKLSDVKELETIDYCDLARAYQKVFPAMLMEHKYTGNAPAKNEYYCGDPLIYGFREHAFSVPLMIGSVFGEFSFVKAGYDKKTMTDSEAMEVLRESFGEHTEVLVEEYRKAYPDLYLLDLLKVDRCMRQPSKKAARLHSAGGGSSWLYMFTLEFPYENGRIAWHCSDIPFVFANTDLVEICDLEGAKELEAKISGAFLQFAKTGDPNIEALPAWPRVSPEEEPTMIYDTTCEVRMNYDDRLYGLMEELLPPFDFFAMIADQDVQH